MNINMKRIISFSYLIDLINIYTFNKMEKIENEQMDLMLGSGSKGKVFLIEINNSMIVRKIFRKGKRFSLMNEVLIYEKLKNINNIPKLLCHTDTFINFEYESGYENLDELLEKISFKEKILVCKQVSEILIECHNIGIVHRDIKPKNILFNIEKQKVLLIDWECSIQTIDGYFESDLKDDYGTLIYSPPEFYSKCEVDYRKVDVWQLCFTFLTFILNNNNPCDENINNLLNHYKSRKSPEIKISKEKISIFGTEKYKRLNDLLFSKVFVLESNRITMNELSEIFKNIHENYLDFI